MSVISRVESVDKQQRQKTDIHCFKCRQKTGNINVSTVQTPNGSWRLTAQCKVCKSRKSKFLKSGWKKTTVNSGDGDDNPDKRKIEAVEMYKPVVKKFMKRRIVTLGIDDMWAADLIVMTNYSDENDGYKYMLNVIDSFSKYAWSEPTKKKDGPTVAGAFRRIISKAKKIGHSSPNLLHTDRGLEFKNKDFKAVLDKHGIKMYHTESKEKSSIVERFNRTLNGKMKRRFYINQNFRWIDILDELMSEYNNRDFHRTIGMSPADVSKENEESILMKLCNSKFVAAASSGKNTRRRPRRPSAAAATDIQVGDRVRITREKKTFGNKYKSNWTKEIFLVDKIVFTQPITYKLRALDGEEIIGSFYRKELLKTSL